MTGTIDTQFEKLTDGELDPRTLSEQERVLLAQCLLGDEAITFLEGDLGKTLMGYADQERDAALEELGTVDPENPKAIRDLQLKVAVANQFIGFIHEALVAADLAGDQLKQ